MSIYVDYQATKSVFPSQTLAVFHDDDEWLSRLIADAQALEEFPSSAFIDRFLKDRYCDTLSCWTEWIAQAEAYGFIIPREISFIQSYDVPSSASTKTRLPARLSESFVRAITILLNVSRDSAIELTTTTLAMSSVDITNDEFEAGLDLILKVVECYHRQRIARLGLLTELLRIEQAASSDSNEHSQAHSTLSHSKAKGIVQQLEPFNLFAILLMAADSQEDREVPSTSLSRPQREALQSLPKTTTFTSFVTNLMQVKNMFVKQQQIKAMEALVALCYERVTIQRAHLIILSVAYSKTTDHLVGMWGLEGLALWRDTPDHPLLQGAQAHDEVRALAKLWQRQCLVSKPFTLMVLGLGLLMQEAIAKFNLDGNSNISFDATCSASSRFWK